MSWLNRALNWLNRNQGPLLGVFGIALIVFGLVAGDWLIRCIIIMTLFFFFIANII